MSDDLKLLPCPFCGGTAAFHGGERFVDKAGGYEPSITCESCGIGFRSGWFGRGVPRQAADQITVDDWNRRVTTAAEVEEIDNA